MERRKYERYKVNLNTTGHNGSLFFNSQIISISEFGAQLVLQNAELNYEQKLKLKINIDNLTYNIEGEVIKIVFDMKFNKSYIVKFNEPFDIGLLTKQSVAA